MALDALSPNELLNILTYDTIFATSYGCNDSSDTSFIPETSFRTQELGGGSVSSSSPMQPRCSVGIKAVDRQQKPVVQGRRKRRKQKVCKNKEEAETQRMTHIAVERNRRKQMNEHLAVLRSLMPKSYVQRGDQASIVGGAIEYVKELEHLLQSLEAQKLLLLLQGGMPPPDTATAATATTSEYLSAPFLQFFEYPPPYTGSKISNNYISKSKAVVVDTEVTLIETHANLRILSTKSFRQVSKMVTGFQTLYLTILHLNVTTLDPVVLYSISAKVEEGCPLKSADDIAGAVHHMLTIIEEESKLC